MVSTSAVDQKEPAVDIPILDLTSYFAGEPGSLEQTADELRNIGENVGFHYVSGHGVSPGLVDATFAQAERFHALPLEEKMKVKVTDDMRGYMPMKASTTRTSDLSQDNRPNVNEAYFVKREISSDDPDFGTPYNMPNVWPELPGFRDQVVGYYGALEALGRRMLPLYAVALGMPADFFNHAFDRPLGGLRMTHYPPSTYGDREFAIAPHTDSSFITVLAQNKVLGLQLRVNDGEWAHAPVIEGTFIINSGDILRRWTNDRFLSTPHRVFNSSGVERYAIPYFMHPNPGYVMECLRTCTSPDDPPRYPTETSADYLRWFTSRNYDHIRAKQGPVDGTN
jgi:isopenicillin N synthase-like dioxygenase